ncbi:2-oxoacid:acceptor oxidoreductase family protein [Clostridium thailandense]|uniref:2-oxoacid:acceptor oxidoreductase family protein n=1 Tax=Clostridium thailandense TaxID=2794346 RepID=UPI0039899DC6
MGHRYEIILSGVGGQGLITSGSILGQAAVIHENMNASLTSSYGVETRGTFTKSDVIISEDQIYYPEVLKADIILALAPVAYNKYVSTLNKDTILIYDSSLVSEIKKPQGKQYGYPITEVALELGSEKVTNIIAIGIIVRKTGVLERKSVIEVLKDKFSKKEKIQKLNILAFEKGFEME